MNFRLLVLSTLLMICNYLVTGAAENAEPTKPCFACKGIGTEQCSAPSCVKGQRSCPQPCLKLTSGKWERMTVAGHPATDLWQKFYLPNSRQSVAYNQNHVGNIVAIQNGTPTDMGPCQTCKGSTKVTCDICKGKALVACKYCNGTKVVPLSWTETSNPKIAADPNYVRLKDGRSIKGKIGFSLGDTVKIKTPDGETIEVKREDLLNPKD